MNKYFDKSKVFIRPINKSLAKEIIVKNHYSHKWTLCQIAYGIFYKDRSVIESESEYIDSVGERLIGCCVYATPVGRSAAKSFSDKIKSSEVFELVRLVIEDGYGSNIESYVISQTMKMVKKNFPNIKIILSYSDEEQGHIGTIYQAAGFYYQGNKTIALMPNYSISLNGPDNYKWIHSRTVNSKWGSHNIDVLKRKIGKTFWRKKESTKHRYFYILTNKIEKQKILSSIKHPCLSYPKNSLFSEEIEKIEVNDGQENLFFT